MGQTLMQQLVDRRQASRSRLSADTLAVMDAATDELARAGVANTSLGPGTPAPEFVLPDATGAAVSLSSVLANGPAVLSFYRGGWCPYCSLELRALQRVLPEITAAGATLVAISPETPDHSLSTAEVLELSFPVLSDVGNRVAESFGLVFTLPAALREVYRGFGIDLPAVNGDATFRLPIPATFVISTDGIVRWRFADPDYTRRAEPTDVPRALAPLTQTTHLEA